MRGISEAGSNPKCLVGEGSVVKKKETAAVYYFSNKITIYKVKGDCYNLLQYIDLVKAKEEASIPTPPHTQPHPFEKLLAYKI